MPASVDATRLSSVQGPSEPFQHRARIKAPIPTARKGSSMSTSVIVAPPAVACHEPDQGMEIKTGRPVDRRPLPNRLQGEQPQVTRASDSATAARAATFADQTRHCHAQARFPDFASRTPPPRIDRCEDTGPNRNSSHSLRAVLRCAMRGLRTALEAHRAAYWLSGNDLPRTRRPAPQLVEGHRRPAPFARRPPGGAYRRAGRVA